ncbi:hypothetical protein DPMN_184368 [Dreissena polymorpha]|uniref:Uncharacterized protein n=1 Tax=Dreissena polymorpha TaxID=45954 RepID=A0A9D4DJ36_DREPO|nr:hypothetical protein DPMN_184368 [Dreissena polymorpha]
MFTTFAYTNKPLDLELTEVPTCRFMWQTSKHRTHPIFLQSYNSNSGREIPNAARHEPKRVCNQPKKKPPMQTRLSIINFLKHGGSAPSKTCLNIQAS